MSSWRDGLISVGRIGFRGVELLKRNTHLHKLTAARGNLQALGVSCVQRLFTSDAIGPTNGA
jgi:hypothetical protein